MIASWLVFVVLAVIAVCFVLWPMLGLGRSSPAPSESESQGPSLDDRLQTNIQLFREHMLELEAALAAGRIEQDQFEQLKLEQERNLLEEEASLAADQSAQTSRAGRFVLLGVSLVLVGVASLLYYQWGSAPDLALQNLQAEKNQLDYQDLLHNREPDSARAREFIAAVEARLEQKPASTQYWFMLARSAMEVGDYPRAIDAYRKILVLDPETSLVMGELAQALFLQNNNRMTPEIVALAQGALKIDAANTTALGLAGISAFENKQFAAAADYWQQAVNVLGKDAPGSRALQGGIERARSEATKAGQPLEQPDVVSGRRIVIRVELGDDLDLPADLPVFVYARAWQGARMPLAIQRLSLADLPVTVTLDESMAMTPTLSLAQADQVEVVARIALDGSATAKAGDWQGSIGPLDLENLPANIVIKIDQKLTE